MSKISLFPDGTITCDLGQDDVHVPATPKRSPMKAYTYQFDGKEHAGDEEEDEHDLISTETRKGLPTEEFALPGKRKYPIDTAARVRNAAARLEQQKKAGGVSDEEYTEAKGRIAKAAKKFGIESEYNRNAGGAAAVTDMNDGAQTADMTARGESVELEVLAANNEALKIWVQVAKPGKFRGHAAGPFEMTNETFTQIIANFRASQNRRIPIDFEHASEMNAAEGAISVQGAPAQGWITDLEIRDDGNLWGLAEWHSLAKKYIRAGQYRFLSPAVVFGAKDRVTGKVIGARLSSVALTNNPFLDGMQQVAAKNTQTPQPIDDELLTTIRTTLEMPSYTKPEHLIIVLKSIETEDKPGPRMLQGPATSFAARLRNALRLPLTMTSADVFSAARIACGEVQAPNTPSPASPAAHETTPPPGARNARKNMTVENNDSELQISKLTLKMNEAEAKVKEHEKEMKSLKDEHEKQMKSMEAKLQEMKLELDGHKERQLTDLVDVTLATYGDKRGLKETDRPHLLRYAKNDYEGFVAMYPPVPPGQRHLSQKIANPNQDRQVNLANQERGGNVVNLRSDDEAHIPSTEKVVAQLMKDGHPDTGEKLTRDQAFALSYDVRRKLFSDAAKKRLGNGG